jgi:hypothetical protein
MMEAWYVFYEVGTQFFNIYINFMLQAMPLAVQSVLYQTEEWVKP